MASTIGLPLPKHDYCGLVEAHGLIEVTAAETGPQLRKAVRWKPTNTRCRFLVTTEKTALDGAVFTRTLDARSPDALLMHDWCRDWNAELWPYGSAQSRWLLQWHAPVVADRHHRHAL
jgi:hypothetical protein